MSELYLPAEDVCDENGEVITHHGLGLRIKEFVKDKNLSSMLSKIIHTDGVNTLIERDMIRVL